MYYHLKTEIWVDDKTTLVYTGRSLKNLDRSPQKPSTCPKHAATWLTLQVVQDLAQHLHRSLGRVAMLLPTVELLDQESGHVRALEAHPVDYGPQVVCQKGRRVSGHRHGDDPMLVFGVPLPIGSRHVDDVLRLQHWSRGGGRAGWHRRRVRHTYPTVPGGRKCQCPARCGVRRCGLRTRMGWGQLSPVTRPAEGGRWWWLLHV